jgi:hypothetical protein
MARALCHAVEFVVTAAAVTAACYAYALAVS